MWVRWNEKRAEIYVEIRNDIKEKAKKLGLDAEKIYDIFLMLLDKDVLRGRSYKNIEAVAFMLYIRQNDIPVTAKKLVELFDYEISLNNLELNYKTAVRKLGIKVPVPSVENRIRYLVSKFNLSKELEDEAIKFVKEHKDLIQGKDPNAVASALIWLLSMKYGHHVTQRALADIFGITDAVIRLHAKEFKKYLKLDQEEGEKKSITTSKQENMASLEQFT